MGTRADFYVGVGQSAEWIGSVAYDGDWWTENRRHADAALIRARSVARFRTLVCAELASRSDATFPGMGWPWPWDSSALTDCVYAFVDGRVCVITGDDKALADFPNMRKPRDGFTIGPRSGALFFR